MKNVLNLNPFVQLCQMNPNVKFAITGSVLMHMRMVKMNRGPKDLNLLADTAIREIKIPKSWTRKDALAWSVPSDDDELVVTINYSGNPKNFRDVLTPYTELGFYADMRELVQVKAVRAMEDTPHAAKHLLDLISIHWETVLSDNSVARHELIGHVDNLPTKKKHINSKDLK